MTNARWVRNPTEGKCEKHSSFGRPFVIILKLLDCSPLWSLQLSSLRRLLYTNTTVHFCKFFLHSGLFPYTWICLNLLLRLTLLTQVNYHRLPFFPTITRISALHFIAEFLDLPCKWKKTVTIGPLKIWVFLLYAI